MEVPPISFENIEIAFENRTLEGIMDIHYVNVSQAREGGGLILRVNAGRPEKTEVSCYAVEEDCPDCREPRHQLHRFRFCMEEDDSYHWEVECLNPPTPMELLAEIELEEA